ncbi:hypothetical protein PR729_14020 [Providencia rettgeri]|nr:hypothetical protein PR729_14020 [Providencia rettgeri]
MTRVFNVLAGSHQNAKDIYAAAETFVVVGVLSKNYPDLESAIADMRIYAQKPIMHYQLAWVLATQINQPWYR